MRENESTKEKLKAAAAQPERLAASRREPKLAPAKQPAGKSLRQRFALIASPLAVPFVLRHSAGFAADAVTGGNGNSKFRC